jgi:uncharacterized protein (DUF433 family)
MGCCKSALFLLLVRKLRTTAKKMKAIEQILKAYPELEAEDINACIQYAAILADDQELAVRAA